MKILIFALIWAVVLSLAFIIPRSIEPTGDGFTRGANRLPATLGLHCLSFLLALFIAGWSYRTRADIDTWLLMAGFAPLLISILAVMLLVVIAMLPI
jgi:hypothetical protein